MGDFVRVVGGWWVGAVFLLLGIAGVVFFNWGGLSAGSLTAVGMLIVMVGAYRAYDRISQEGDELWERLEHDTARFMIKAGVRYAGTVRSQ